MKHFTSSDDAPLFLLNSSFTYWSPRALKSMGRNRSTCHKSDIQGTAVGLDVCTLHLLSEGSGLLSGQVNQEDEEHHVSFILHHGTDDGISFPSLRVGPKPFNTTSVLLHEGCGAGVKNNNPPDTTRVLCWIMTGPKNLESRTKHIRETWAKRCNQVLYMSSVKTDFPTVALNVSEGRDNLYWKTIRAFQYVHQHHLDQADWFLKADDDTFVVMENLRYILSKYDPEQPLYLGRRFTPFIRQGYMSGGAGYVLSKEALRRFVTGFNTGACTHFSPIEDLALGKCMETMEVKPADSRDVRGRQTFHPYPPDRYLVRTPPRPRPWYLIYDHYTPVEGPGCCSDFVVSFHYIYAVQQYVLEYLTHRKSCSWLQSQSCLRCPDNLRTRTGRKRWPRGRSTTGLRTADRDRGPEADCIPDLEGQQGAECVSGGGGALVRARVLSASYSQSVGVWGPTTEMAPGPPGEPSMMSGSSFQGSTDSLVWTRFPSGSWTSPRGLEQLVGAVDGAAREGALAEVRHLPDGGLDVVPAELLLQADHHLVHVAVEHHADPPGVSAHRQLLHDAGHKVLHQLKVLWAHALGAVNHKHQLQRARSALETTAWATDRVQRDLETLKGPSLHGHLCPPVEKHMHMTSYISTVQEVLWDQKAQLAPGPPMDKGNNLKYSYTNERIMRGSRFLTCLLALPYLLGCLPLESPPCLAALGLQGSPEGQTGY
ncbi:hypothetical protein FQN60_014597, partial [Etheostoma spectabile]